MQVQSSAGFGTAEQLRGCRLGAGPLYSQRKLLPGSAGDSGRIWAAAAVVGALCQLPLATILEPFLRIMGALFRVWETCEPCGIIVTRMETSCEQFPSWIWLGTPGLGTPAWQPVIIVPDSKLLCLEISTIFPLALI